MDLIIEVEEEDLGSVEQSLGSSFEPGGEPLVDKRYELFLRDVLAGVPKYLSYMNNVSRGQCSRKTAEVECTRVLRRPEVKSRYQYLVKQIEVSEAPASFRQAIAFCSKVLNDKSHSVDERMKAMDRLNTLLQWSKRESGEDRGKPDPAFFVEFIKNMRTQFNSLQNP